MSNFFGEVKSPSSTAKPLPKSSSRPILIGGDKRTPKRDKILAKSCPDPYRPLIPNAPAHRPKLAPTDPPLLDLPPTPPVGLEASIPSDNKSETRKVLSRSLIHYSSSLPNNLDFLSTNFSLSIPTVEETQEPDEYSDDDDMSAAQFGKSPTIITLLKTEAFSPGIGRLSQRPSLQTTTTLIPPSSKAKPTVQKAKEVDDFDQETDNADELQFAISLDPSDEVLDDGGSSDQFY